jgi:hypothetical protein
LGKENEQQSEILATAKMPVGLALDYREMGTDVRATAPSIDEGLAADEAGDDVV